MTWGWRRTSARFVVAAAVVVVGALVIGLLQRPLFGAGVAAVHDATALRDQLTVCDRTYRRGPGSDAVNAAAAGRPLVLVDPAVLAPCPAADASGNRPCSRSADGPCATVVYVRVGPDAYVPYELVSGP